MTNDASSDGRDPFAPARAALDRNFATLERIEARADRAWRAGDAGRAAMYAQLGGGFAYLNHPGVFASEPLERLLGAIGRQEIGTAGVCARPSTATPRSVLHVLTEGYLAGGHTRLAWRWMELDAAREHHVVLTQPRCAPPQPLVAAAASIELLDPYATLLQRAAALRRIAAGHDLVVLHVHMFDVIPSLAFAEPRDRPPVVFVDHADHLFWLGANVADVVTACRPPASALQVERRGIAPERCVSLPVPLPPPAPADRERSRALLGIADDELLLLSVASSYKFASALRPSWLDVACAALEAVPRSRLIAVGPPQAGEWVEAAKRTGGRLAAVGARDDLDVYLAAADVYLDSYPFSSNTAVAEAALAGLPVVSFAPDPAGQGMLLTHDPGFEGEIVRGATPAEVAALVADLAAAPALRRERGRRTSAGSAAAHVGDGWRDALREVYATAAAVGPTPGAGAAPRRPATFELLHHLTLAAARPIPDLAGCVANQLATIAEAPVGEEAVAQLVRELDSAPPRRAGRAIAAPELSAPSIARLLATMSALAAGGRADGFVVALPTDRVDEGVSLLSAALDDALEIDVVPTDAPEELLRPSDLWVGPAGSRQLVAATARRIETVAYS